MYQVSGRVIHGAQYGRKLGFPTANLDRRSFSRRKMKVRLGIYAGRAQIISNFQFPISNKNPKSKILNPKSYLAAIVIGPIDERHLPKLEVHLLNFKGNLYSKKLAITLQKYIRQFKKFKNEEKLKKQIKKDIDQVKKYERIIK